MLAERAKVAWGTGLCDVENITDSGYFIASCDGNQYEIWNEGVKFSYLQNPGPVKCKVIGVQLVTCEGRPFKPPSTQ
jgi:hypothetical protein